MRCCDVAASTLREGAMKRLARYAVVVLAILGLVSTGACKKDWLDLRCDATVGAVFPYVDSAAVGVPRRFQAAVVTGCGLVYHEITSGVVWRSYDTLVQLSATLGDGSVQVTGVRPGTGGIVAPGGQPTGPGDP